MFIVNYNILCYRQVYDGEENRDKRMHCTFNILVSKMCITAIGNSLVTLLVI